MDVNFTNSSKEHPKEPYMLPHIDRPIDGASDFRFLSLMDVYSSYNQLRMDLLDAPDITFMTNKNNCYYKVIPFGFKM